PRAFVSGTPLFSLSSPAAPSWSSKPSLSSATSGHLSEPLQTPAYLAPCPFSATQGSQTPSASLSGSGQPSVSWKPSLSSGSFLHSSYLLGMPSLSEPACMGLAEKKAASTNAAWRYFIEGLP